jgi:hypothetical protein
MDAVVRHLAVHVTLLTSLKLSHYHMLPNLNSHTRHLSTFHSLPIIVRLHLHINLLTRRLAHYARSVTNFAAGLRSTCDSIFDTVVPLTMRIRFEALRPFAAI